MGAVFFIGSLGLAALLPSEFIPVEDQSRSSLTIQLPPGTTLDEAGMLFANQASWAHVLQAAAGLLDKPVTELLSIDELAAVQGRGDPRCLR